MQLERLKEIFFNHQIINICFDSRLVKPGDAFFAISGNNKNGYNYIEDALLKGAKIIFTDHRELLNKANIYYVPDIRRCLADAAAVIYPEIPENLISTTGTNGKTSVMNYCYQIFNLLGVKAGLLCSTGIYYSNNGKTKTYRPELELFSTYDPITARQALSFFNDQNIQHVALEATSHGIDQMRVHGFKFKAIGFTSFGSDHMDHHKTKEHYLEAKLKLFKNNLAKDGVAIIDSCIDQKDTIVNFFKQNQINYLSVGIGGNITYKISCNELQGQKVITLYNNKEYHFTTPIIGNFQINNLLIAALIVESCGFEFEQIIKQINYVKAVSGRLERVTDHNSEYHIFVDHSHKPEALEQTLIELKKLIDPLGKLIIVFGCGGNRDSIKRPIMGKIASKLANQVIVTDDNPRFEEASSIRKQIIAGIHGDYTEIGDRYEAIQEGISRLKTHDILLIAGKGSEKYQLIKDQQIPFNDYEIAKNINNGK